MKKPEQWTLVDIFHNPEGAFKAGVPMARINETFDVIHQYVTTGVAINKNHPKYAHLKPH